MKTLHVTIYDEYECWSWHMFIYFLKFSSKKFILNHSLQNNYKNSIW